MILIYSGSVTDSANLMEIIFLGTILAFAIWIEIKFKGLRRRLGLVSKRSRNIDGNNDGNDGGNDGGFSGDY